MEVPKVRITIPTPFYKSIRWIPGVKKKTTITIALDELIGIVDDLENAVLPLNWEALSLRIKAKGVSEELSGELVLAVNEWIKREAFKS
jgi:hypothetical protein